MKNIEKIKEALVKHSRAQLTSSLSSVVDAWSLVSEIRNLSDCREPKVHEMGLINDELIF